MPAAGREGQPDRRKAEFYANARTANPSPAPGRGGARSAPVRAATGNAHRQRFAAFPIIRLQQGNIYGTYDEIAIRSFVDSNGRVPFQVWLDSLDRQTQARITVALTRLARGNRSRVKGVGGGVAELKLDFGPGYRIYFGQDGETLIILLAGGTKRRQNEDIATARARWAEYKELKTFRHS